MADIQTQLPVRITNGSNEVVVTAGNALKVDNSNVTQPVSGSVSVSNFPATQPVSGTVTANAGTGTFTVGGSVSVSNFPTTQPVSGTVAVSSVSGTVSVAAGEVTSGVVVSYGTSTAVASASVGTITYVVTSGKTLYLKQIHASASGGPCRVEVTTGTGSQTTYLVGFFSAANPNYDFTFAQPLAVSAGIAVNVKITNNAGADQDVYATILGHEV